MPRRTSRLPAPALPLALWTDLALRTGEMLAASAQVISHRTGRMALAGPAPNARDRKEFTRMVAEKVAAANESAMAMSRHWMTTNLVLGASPAKNLSKLAHVSARASHQGLKPFHSRATANAKRLGRVKPLK